MKKVLFVDDEPELLALFEHVCGSFDNRVLLALSVKDAMEVLKSHDVGLIICDYLMPRSNGNVLLEHVRSQLPDCRFFYYTGVDSEDLPAEPRADGIFQKPLDAGKVVKLMRDFIGMGGDLTADHLKILTIKS